MAGWFLEAAIYAEKGDTRVFHLYCPEGEALKVAESRGELVAGEGVIAYEQVPRHIPNQKCVEFEYLSHRQRRAIKRAAPSCGLNYARNTVWKGSKEPKTRVRASSPAEVRYALRDFPDEFLDQIRVEASPAPLKLGDFYSMGWIGRASTVVAWDMNQNRPDERLTQLEELVDGKVRHVAVLHPCNPYRPLWRTKNPWFQRSCALLCVTADKTRLTHAIREIPDIDKLIVATRNKRLALDVASCVPCPVDRVHWTKDGNLVVSAVVDKQKAPDDAAPQHKRENMHLYDDNPFV